MCHQRRCRLPSRVARRVRARRFGPCCALHRQRSRHTRRRRQPATSALRRLGRPRRTDTPKPSWYAQMMWQQLDASYLDSPQLPADGIWTAVTRDAHHNAYTLLAATFRAVDATDRTLQLNVSGLLPGHWHVTLYQLDRDHPATTSPTTNDGSNRARERNLCRRRLRHTALLHLRHAPTRRHADRRGVLPVSGRPDLARVQFLGKRTDRGRYRPSRQRRRSDLGYLRR
jgi:hypothetical protein